MNIYRNVFNKSKDNLKIEGKKTLKKGIFKLLLVISLFNQIIPNNHLYLLISKLSNITLKIKGPGNGKIFNSAFGSLPNKIYINGKEQKDIKREYYFNQTENKVELVWDNKIQNCQFMFRDCSNIFEIYFPNFDTTEVTLMDHMFQNLNLLTSLDLSNFDNSKVVEIDNMFNGCENLEYINMKNFKKCN